MPGATNRKGPQPVAAIIPSAEIGFYYSVVTGAAGNSTAGTAAGSLGKYLSTTAWAGGVANDLFDNISGAENAASTVDYRCILIRNLNGANALQNAVLYLSAETAGGASIAVGVDTSSGLADRPGGGSGGTDSQRNHGPSRCDLLLTDHRRHGLFIGHHRSRAVQSVLDSTQRSQHGSTVHLMV